MRLRTLAWMAACALVCASVRTALVQFNQARQAEEMWTRGILPSIETEQRQAESAYRADELPLMSLLDVTPRLGEARLRSIEASTSLARAVVSLDQSVGRMCVGQDVAESQSVGGSVPPG